MAATYVEEEPDRGKETETAHRQHPVRDVSQVRIRTGSDEPMPPQPRAGFGCGFCDFIADTDQVAIDGIQLVDQAEGVQRV